jgi:endonuclease YncB( thermonuclease family)
MVLCFKTSDFKPPKGFDSTPYLEAEREVRETKRGMWSLGDKYIRPREWRKRHRKGQ